ncbi:hypothetical protein [Deinococcus roseus]|uniref:Uncharacterized protein n=1 Tax=Deinococcus roseus TaxID=392414 RepID=A0ABQ2D0W1_9DEIO|nr:hypothetical protein [Deinococcus roseus]GGJ32755.1 hypothetical protein GCM10008938_18700 [Deinococcus roseus]
MTRQSGRINLVGFNGRVELVQFGASVEVRGCGRLDDAGSIIRAYFAGKDLIYEGSCKYPDGEIRQVRIPITLWNPDLIADQARKAREVFFESLGTALDPSPA